MPFELLLQRNSFITSGIFKEHNLLKLDDIYKQHCLKLFYKIEHNLCSDYTRSLLVHNRNIHDHNTRGRNDVRPTSETRSTWLRHSLPRIIHDTPDELLNLNCTIQTFSKQLSNYFISSYESECTLATCLPCGRQARDEISLALCSHRDSDNSFFNPLFD